jgi:hypothetical protein
MYTDGGGGDKWWGIGWKQQITDGNDRKKSKSRSNDKGKRNDGMASVVSHPCLKFGDKDGAPAFVGIRGERGER